MTKHHIHTVARLLALAGLTADRVRPPPNDGWDKTEWEKRVLECIPGAEEEHCRKIAELILAEIESWPAERKPWIDPTVFPGDLPSTEEAAERIWQNESLRATGKPRRITWAEEGDQEKSRFRWYALSALVGVSPRVPLWPVDAPPPSDYCAIEGCLHARHGSPVFPADVSPFSGAANPLSIVAEALDCFWNASIGSARNSQDPAALAMAGALAEGFAAIATRLREGVAEQLHGPFGYLVIDPRLDEEHWRFENEPDRSDPTLISIALFTKQDPFKMVEARAPQPTVSGECAVRETGENELPRAAASASAPYIVAGGDMHLTRSGIEKINAAGLAVRPGEVRIMKAGAPPFIPFDPAPGGSIEFWRDMDVCRRLPERDGAKLATALVRRRVWNMFDKKEPTPATAPAMNRAAEALMVEAQQRGFAEPMWHPPSFP